MGDLAVPNQLLQQHYEALPHLDFDGGDRLHPLPFELDHLFKDWEPGSADVGAIVLLQVQLINAQFHVR